VFSFQILITLFPNKINHKSAIIFNFQRASSIFTRLTSRIFQDELITKKQEQFLLTSLLFFHLLSNTFLKDAYA